MGGTIPTLYYSLKEDCHLDEAYKSLNRCCIFDTAFCTSAIYKHEYKTASAWISQVTSEIIEKAEDDLFVVCNSELSFNHDLNEDDICQRIVEAGSKGAQILLGNTDTVGDLYKVGNNLYWADVFFHTSFIVIYKSAFEQIARMSSQEGIEHMALEQILILLLDYKFISYPFLALNKDFHIGTDSKQTWYNNITSHFYEGLDAQIKTYNDTRKLFPYDQSKGYYSFQPNESNY